MSGIGGRSGSRISFRPRPIDVSKPLPIVRTEIEDDDSQRMVPLMPTGMESNEEGELHIQEIIQSSMKKRHEDLPEIPIPVVKIVDDYDTADNPHPFQLGTTYVLYKLLNDEELDQTVEYDLDSDDEAFVGTINQGAMAGVNGAISPQMNGGGSSSKRQNLSLDRFEAIIDKFEKELYYTGQCDTSKAEQICKGLKPSIAHALLNHWQEKRKSRSTLIRRLLKQPDRDDPSPYKAFRAREVEQKQKKGRKNDQASLVKMNALRQEFERARTLLEMIKKREKLKKDYMVVISDLHTKLKELAEIKLLEPEVDLPPPTSSNNFATPNNVVKKLKQKDTHKDGSTATIAIEESPSPTPHNYPGPAFMNKEQQPLILGNGKARQEGYRHYIVKPGQYPSPTLEKLYSTPNPASPTLKTESSIDDLTQDTEEQLKKEEIETQRIQELEEAAKSYYNSLPAPTSAEYYDDDDDDEDESDDESPSSTSLNNNNNNNSTTSPHKLNPRTRNGRQRLTGGKAAPISSHYQSPSYSTTIQPKMNPDGVPIYPSVNQGYIFISPNLPPLLGRARVGRYGGTYIDIVPVDKQTRVNFLNQLKQQKELEKQKYFEKKDQLKQQRLNNLNKINQKNNNSNNNNNSDDNDHNNDNSNDNSNNNNNNVDSTNNNNSTSNISIQQNHSTINIIDKIDIDMDDFNEFNQSSTSNNDNNSNNSNENIQNIPTHNNDLNSSVDIKTNNNNQQQPSPSSNQFNNDDRSSNKRKLDIINENNNNDKVTKITDFQMISKQHANGGSSSSSNGGSGTHPNANGSTSPSTSLHNGGDSVSTIQTTPLSAQKKLKTTPVNSPNGNTKSLKSKFISSTTNHIEQYLIKKTAPTSI